MAPQYVAEFIGTFMLVFSVGCNVLSGAAAWGVTSIACTLMVSIYALGSVSGANFNPAVSVALGCSQKLAWCEILRYVAVQMLAGALAGIAYGSMFFEVFDLQPAKGFNWWQAGTVELLYTFMLCFVVLNVAASKMHAGHNQFYGLAIAFCVVAGGYGGGHISGGCFNPAVAFGVDLSSLGMGFGWCIVYIIFELSGAILASALFSCCRPEECTDDDAPAPGDYPLSSRILSEFLGTFFLVLTVGLNVLGGSQAPVWSIAASLTSMVFALGTCSGAHFNPAVTVAIAAAGRDKIAIADIPVYICTQILAGIVAAFLYQSLENGEVFPLLPGAGATVASSWIMEMLFTFLLCFVVLSVATIEDSLSQFFGLAIGSCVTAGGYAIGAISGGCLNPAVAAGIALTSLFKGHGIFHLLPYVIFELFGGLLAAYVFRRTRPREYEEPLLAKLS